MGFLFNWYERSANAASTPANVMVKQKQKHTAGSLVPHRYFGTGGLFLIYNYIGEMFYISNTV